MKIQKLIGRPVDAAPGQYRHPRDSRLTLVVHATGKRAWRARPRVDGKQTFLSFEGSLSADAVLALALPLFTQAKSGINPREALELEQAEAKAAHVEKMKAQVTFAQVRDEMLASASVTSKRSATQKNLVWALRSTHVRHFEQRNLRSITSKDLEAVKDKLMAQGRLSSWHTVGGCVRRLFKYALRHEYIIKDPTVGVEVPAAPKRPDSMIRGRDWAELTATLAALDAFIAEQPGVQHSSLYYVLAYSGIRPGAAERLRMQDFHDGDEPSITITAEASKLGREITIPVSTQCAAVLRSAIASHPDLLAAKQRASALIWPGYHGGPVAKSMAAITRINELRGDNGGKWVAFRPHRFRKSAITWLETQANVSDYTLCRLVDWLAKGQRESYVDGHDVGRAAIQAYADALDRQRGGPSNVVNLGRAA